MVDTEAVDYTRFANIEESTGADLIARGKQMLALGEQLLTQARQLRELPPPPPALESESVREEFAPIEISDDQLRAVSSLVGVGVIDKTFAIAAAQEMKLFTRDEFGKKLGLRGATVNRWLMALLNDHRLERIETDEGPKYKSIKLTHPREHETKNPPENERPSYELAQATGMPVRIRTERNDRRARSTPGQRQKTIQRDRNYDRIQAAKLERAVEQRKKAAASAGKPPGRRKSKASKPVT